MHGNNARYSVYIFNNSYCSSRAAEGHRHIKRLAKNFTQIVLSALSTMQTTIAKDSLL